jgi:hypothetical protein
MYVAPWNEWEWAVTYTGNAAVSNVGIAAVEVLLHGLRFWWSSAFIYCRIAAFGEAFAFHRTSANLFYCSALKSKIPTKQSCLAERSGLIFERYVFEISTQTTTILTEVSWGGVRLRPFGTSAANWPIIPAPDDSWVWIIWWNKNWQGKPKYSEETCPSASLSTINCTWPGMEPGSPLREAGD